MFKKIFEIIESVLAAFAGKSSEKDDSSAEEKAQAEQEENFRTKYAETMARVNSLVGPDGVGIYDYSTGERRLTNPEETKKVLASFRKMVANDLATETTAQFLYGEVLPSASVTLLPYMYDTAEKQDVMLPYSQEERDIEVDNTKMTPFIVPGMMDRLAGHILRKSDISAKKMALSDLPKLYVNFGVVTPGGNRHKLVDAFVNRNCGTIRVRVVDDTPLFEGLWTDGAWWYSTLTNRKVQKVADWRVAVMFSIRKMEMSL